MINHLKPYHSQIVLASMVLFVVGFIFKNGALTSLVGIILTAPLAVSILQQKSPTDIWRSDITTAINYLRFALLILAIWLVSISLFKITWKAVVVSQKYDQFMSFLVFALFSFLMLFIAPKLYQIATSTKGQRLSVWDSFKIYLMWTVYAFSRSLGDVLSDVTQYASLMVSPLSYYLFVVILCLQSVIILQRNQIEKRQQ